jgi:DNA (cytosine-5)-methyltransferase 1
MFKGEKFFWKSMTEPSDTRLLRLNLGMAQKELARISKISTSDISKIERGLIVPSARQAQALAEALDANAKSIIKAHNALIETRAPGEGYTTARSNGFEFKAATRVPDGSAYRVLDLFCGCGGLSYGFEQTGLFAVTGGIDLLPDRIDTFRNNHPYAATIRADIRAVSRRELEALSFEPDVIVGGPPCQGFSSIRPFRTLSEGDPRNSLVEEYLLAVAEIRPKWFVFENVVGLLTHDKGRTFASLLDGFRAAGYTADWRIINLALLGLPQARERLVIVGNRVGETFEWPEPTHEYAGRSMAGSRAKRLSNDPLFVGRLPPATSVMEAICDLPAVSSGEMATNYLPTNKQNDFTRKMRHGASGLTLHEATKHSPKMLEIIKLAGSNRAALPAGLTSSGFSSCYSRLDADKPSVTITVNFVHPASNRCIHPHQDRALTPREGARLQGFPDKFDFCGTRAQIIKQIGNAVPPILGEAIAMKIAQQLK